MPLALQRRTQGYFPCRAALADSAVAFTTTASNSIALVVNAAPTSTWVAPMDSITFTAPANIILSATATASDSDGSISQVDFYNGITLIGTVLSGSAGDTGSGYTTTWSNVAPCTYQLTAKATDNNGARVTTTAVTVTVNATAATIYYIHPDHLGTPRVITTSDATNTKVWEWSNSDPFGANLPNEDPSATGTAFKYNLRFAGQYFDSETNTSYNYFRDYDPSLGRYVQSDPIGINGGINTFSYVSGRPIEFTDPSGRAVAIPAAVLTVGAILILSTPDGQQAVSNAVRGTIGAIKKVCEAANDLVDPCISQYTALQARRLLVISAMELNYATLSTIDNFNKAATEFNQRCAPMRVEPILYDALPLPKK